MARSILVVAYLVCASALISKNIEKQEEDKPRPNQKMEEDKPHKKDKTRDELKENASEGEKKASKVLMTNGKTITVAAEYQSGRTQAERAAMPKFLLKAGPAPTDGDFSWARYRWSYDNPGMVKHPARVGNADKAQFVVTCCLAKETKGHFMNLPKRSPERPYLVKALDGRKAVQDVLAKRPDMYLLNYDLRDSLAPNDEPLRGVTIAPHNYFAGNPLPENARRKFFLTFQGRKTSKLRRELHDAFNGPSSKYRNWKNISVETIDRMHNYKQQTGDAHFNMKMDTTYSLLPKGDDRWSLRFSEALGAGAIPVVLAQGLTLPYENIIDWSKAAISLPNSYAGDANKIMAALPTDEETIKKMRHEVYEINRKYFATPEARADAMLLDAAALVQKKGKYEPIWDYTAQKGLEAAFKETVSDGQI